MGGLILSQVVTLYTTPVIYLYLDGFRARLARWNDRLPWNHVDASTTL
jgi:multidrug efflux pump